MIPLLKNFGAKSYNWYLGSWEHDEDYPTAQIRIFFFNF
jgi:hypothetical protein